MADRRSGRARKQVNYSNFDTELDDDFADTTPPPSKKQKKSDSTVEDKKASKVKPVPKLSARSNRVPLDEKLYERDLQAALELSLVNSQSESEQESQSQTQQDERSEVKTVTVAIASGPVLHSTPLSVETEVLDVKETGEQMSPTILPSAIACGVADDGIEFLGTITCSDESPEKKRSATTTKKKSVYVADDDDSEGDEDFSVNEASNSESEYEDQNDSDFDADKPKGKSKAAKGRQKAMAKDKKTKPGPATRRTKTASKNTVPKMAVSHVSPKPVATAKPTTPSPVTNRTVTGAAVKRPAWTPPGRSSSESLSAGVSTLKSPSSGLRLGLSRNVRVKPLHPSLKVT